MSGHRDEFLRNQPGIESVGPIVGRARPETETMTDTGINMEFDRYSRCFEAKIYFRQSFGYVRSIVRATREESRSRPFYGVNLL